MITVQQVIAAVAQDAQNQLGPEHPALVDYVNRVHLEILRLSRWKFTLSAPQRFLTREGVTDYWIGATGAGAVWQYDTGLGITNLQTVRHGTVYDRSNFRALAHTDDAPDMPQLAYRDSVSRLGKPRLWRNAPDTPNVLNIYPAPDNQNSYLPVPTIPVLKTTAGGTLAARTYYVRASLVDSAGGEGAPCAETSLFIPTNYLLTVGPPQAGFAASASGVTYANYNLYIGETSGSETRQTTSPVATTTAWTEPTSGLVDGAGVPTEATIAPLGGYLIEFRYFLARTQLTTAGQVLQIPEDYRDVVVAGVNKQAFQLLAAQNPNYLAQASFWASEYQVLKTDLIRDANMFPRGGEFVRPDVASSGQNQPGLNVVDPSTLL